MLLREAWNIPLCPIQVHGWDRPQKDGTSGANAFFTHSGISRSSWKFHPGIQKYEVVRDLSAIQALG
jgi:hypothetical protein